MCFCIDSLNTYPSLISNIVLHGTYSHLENIASKILSFSFNYGNLVSIDEKLNSLWIYKSQEKLKRRPISIKSAKLHKFYFHRPRILFKFLFKALKSKGYIILSKTNLFNLLSLANFLKEVKKYQFSNKVYLFLFIMYNFQKFRISSIWWKNVPDDCRFQ
jgi:hypothetical protein